MSSRSATETGVEATDPVGVVGRLYYPLTMAGAVGAAWALHRMGVPLSLAAFVAVTGAGVTVVVGERIIPHSSNWKPTGAEVVDDGLFLLTVQVLTPLALAWLTVRTLQAGLESAGWTLQVWPSAWPLWAQVGLKIAAGDFLRYWLHRWSHEHGPLWRLHCVHHQPRKLYALNVLRFHPADKAVQFLGDTLPFILLGVGPEVLSYYFVIYATGGFFQHSNLNIRLGWLNYLVVGPEVHRWHHARAIEDSNANYAHTFALWDVLFGTYHRPSGRRVGELGLLDEGYPTTFARQLAAPLHRSGSPPSHAEP